jgi:hypothetical protein
MNMVEIGAEAALFPEKEYINGIFVAACRAHNFPKMPRNKSDSKRVNTTCHEVAG